MSRVARGGRSPLAPSGVRDSEPKGHGHRAKPDAVREKANLALLSYEAPAAVA